MKKAVKVCLITSAVFIALGIGVSVSAFAMGATLDSKYGRSILNYAESYEVLGDFTNSEQGDFYDIKNLKFDVDEGLIELVESDDTATTNKLTVKYNAPDAKVSFRQSGDTLEIKSEVKHRRFRFNHFNYRTSQIQVIVPKDYQFYDVDVETGASEFIADFLYADKLNVDAGVGRVDISEGRVGELEMSGGVGTLVYSGSVDGDISMDGGVGSMDVTLTGNEDDFNYKISCGVGSVKVGGDQYSGLGDRKINNDANKTMDIECGVGSINVQFN